MHALLPVCLFCGQAVLPLKVSSPSCVVVRTQSTRAGELVNEWGRPPSPMRGLWEIPCLQEEVGKEAPGQGPGGNAPQHLGDKSELGADTVVILELVTC